MALALALPAHAQFDKVLQGLGGRGNQSDSKTASGLKEALQIGTDHAVDLTGTTDGFLKNEAIKILLPDKLRTLGKGLRMAGMAPKIDKFEVSMNRAAETAAPRRSRDFQGCLAADDFRGRPQDSDGWGYLGHGIFQVEDFRDPHVRL